jgi:hypothetical protein
MTGWTGKVKTVLGLALDGLAVGLIFAGGVLVGFLLTLPFWY